MSMSCQYCVTKRKYTAVSLTLGRGSSRIVFLIQKLFSKDRAIYLWNTRNWSCNQSVILKNDYASLIRWSRDANNLVIKRHEENIIERFEIKRVSGVITSVVSVKTYSKFQNGDIVGLGLSANGRFIISSSHISDVIIFDLAGNILQRLFSSNLVAYSTRVSPCGKFIVTSGFHPHAGAWYVKYTDFDVDASKTFALKGHDSGIYDVAFDAYSTKVGTVSKDGTWKLFDINLEHGEGFSPRELAPSASGNYEQEEISKIALSPSGNVVAITSGASLYLYNAKTAELLMGCRDIFSGHISRVLYDSKGLHILVAGDNHVKVFSNSDFHYFESL